MGNSPFLPSITQVLELINSREDNLAVGADVTDGNAGGILHADSDTRVANPADITVDTTTDKFKVDQSSATGAIPVLHLDQADVSEEVIRVTGTAASGVYGGQTLVNGADVTTITKAAFIRINIQDDGNQITDGDYYLEAFLLE